MIRGALLTLGTIATLASLSATRADELSLSDWPLVAPAVPATTGVFPKFPENWADLPVTLRISESVGYNSNIAYTPNTLGFGRPIGALESTSTYGMSFKHTIDGGPTFFADGSWGLDRYLNNAFYNNDHYNLDAGMNFKIGTKCDGKLVGSGNKSTSLPGQQVAYNVINSVTTSAFNGSLNCPINGEYSAQLGSGISNSANSAFADQYNNFQSVFVSAGITYAAAENTVQASLTSNSTDYSDRFGLIALAAASGTLTSQALAALLQTPSRNVTQDTGNLIYTRQFGPNVSLNASVGVVGVRDEAYSVSFPRTILPQYSVGVHWSATPKLTLNLSAAQSVTAPTSIVSNLQVSDSASASFGYLITPKISLNGSVGVSHSSGAATPAVFSQVLQPYTSSENSLSAGGGLSYSITPFLAASLTYSYNRTVQSNATVPTSTLFLALNFNPY